MHAWEQIQKTVDYIEEHMADELKPDILAGVASLSSFYFQRLFGRLVKTTVNEYIRLRRVAKASEALLSKEERIVDIALSHGFASHESFTRAFKSAFGITPEEYRAHPIRLNCFNKPQLLLNYTIVDENTPLIADDIILEISQKHLSSSLYFFGCVAEEPIMQMPSGENSGIDGIGKLWDAFHDAKPNINGLKDGGDELGVAFAGTKEGYYRYFAGAEAVSNEPPHGMALWELPEGKYIVCSFEAEDFDHLIMDAVHKAHRYLFETWLPYQRITVEPFAAELYASHDSETNSMEIWLKINDES